MPAKAAFDSNVVLYLLSPDEHKAETAARLLGCRGIVSVQVLNEVANVMRRKMQAEVRPLTVAVQQRGLEIARKHQFSIYDAMIVASAVEASCSVLYSEDMQHGFRLDELRICNPFAKALPS